MKHETMQTHLQEMAVHLHVLLSQDTSEQVLVLVLEDCTAEMQRNILVKLEMMEIQLTTMGVAAPAILRQAGTVLEDPLRHLLLDLQFAETVSRKALRHVMMATQQVAMVVQQLALLSQATNALELVQALVDYTVEMQRNTLAKVEMTATSLTTMDAAPLVR